ncbi:MAG TPA: glycine--tRNA ligase [Nitrolancea sp.]|nr:glycine--tRNA ligase [Nitrolancea sp.]
MTEAQRPDVAMETIVSLARRRGFIFPGSEIYGGLANTWDYGPLGVELKRNIKNAWWEFFVHGREDIVGIDGSILLHPRAWEASGHVQEFNDPLVDCRSCGTRYRADNFIEEKLGKSVEGLPLSELSEMIRSSNVACPVCGKRDWTDVRQFNLMFETMLGPVESSGTRVFLRPETAQAIFLDYRSVMQSSRTKIPFGIAQIGKAFRNEITPGNFIFRLLEFELMEIEYFVRESEWPPAFEDMRDRMGEFFRSLGLREDRLRTREHEEKELSHYSKRTVDFEYRYPFGWKELCGLAYRGDFDLRRHGEYSGVDLSYFDQQSGERFIPHVIEPAMGVDRLLLVLLLDAYDEEEAADVNGKPYTRVVLRLHPSIAPYQVAVLPLMKKPEFVQKAADVQALLRRSFSVEYDETQSIGRRYRRQDEIGTPFCVTIDYESLDDQAVTIRERETMAQIRVPISEVARVLEEKIANWT